MVSNLYSENPSTFTVYFVQNYVWNIYYFFYWWTKLLLCWWIASIKVRTIMFKHFGKHWGTIWSKTTIVNNTWEVENLDSPEKTISWSEETRNSTLNLKFLFRINLPWHHWVLLILPMQRNQFKLHQIKLCTNIF